MSVNRSSVNLVYGLTNPSQVLSPEPIFARRAPTSSDVATRGTFWYFLGTPTLIYIFTSSGTWTQLSTQGAGDILSSLTVNGATALNGTLVVTTGNTALTLNAGTGAISIGTNAASSAITMGNITGTTAIALNSSSSGIVLNANSTGNINVVSGKVTSASTTVTNSSNIGTTTITGLTTAASASFTVTMTNTKVSTTSGVIVTASSLNASGNGAFLAVSGVRTANNTLTITVINNGGGALGAGDDVHISHMVLS